MSKVRVRTSIAVAAALLLMPVSSEAYPRPASTRLISLGHDGAPGDRPSGALHYSFWGCDCIEISADGDQVAFVSAATNLVPGDANDAADIFVRDLQSGVLELVSATPAGTPANSDSYEVALSGDGRFVAFGSNATDLLGPPTQVAPHPAWFSPPRAGQIYVRDRETGTTEVVSVSDSGKTGNSGSWWPEITPDGRYVTFVSAATNLVPNDTNELRDVFVHDRLTRRTERVSVSSAEEESNARVEPGEEAPPTISSDGRFVAFSSDASNLVAGDGNAMTDVFVRDRLEGTTERVSLAPDGSEGPLRSTYSSISPDGNLVAFASFAPNFAPSQPSVHQGATTSQEIYVRDRARGTTIRASISSSGLQGAGSSIMPRFSSDGRFLTFATKAGRALADDDDSFSTGDGIRLMLHDLLMGTTEDVGVRTDGSRPPSGVSVNAAVSAGARVVAFMSQESLADDDHNPSEDVYVRDRGPVLGVSNLAAGAAAGGVRATGTATFTGAVLADVQDAPDDAAPGAKEAGAELTGAALVYRHEREDLLIRWSLGQLPSVPATGFAGTPGTMYGLSFSVGSVRYEVRLTQELSIVYRCDVLCEPLAPVKGSVGAGGVEARAAVPLTALPGVSPGTPLVGVTASARVGEVATADEAALGSVVLPEASVVVELVDRDDAARTVRTAAPLGAFDATLPTADLAPGPYEVRARACLADACGPPARTPVTVG